MRHQARIRDTALAYFIEQKRELCSLLIFIKRKEMDKYSNISIREPKLSKSVQISSDSKPEILASVIAKWQALLDTTAKIINVPSGLIMRLNEKTIQVFMKSQTEGNPYEVGEEAELIYGLYCETVIGTQKQLLVPDATKSPIWCKNNPDIDLNMISYLGFPINWPDGEVFGTVCLLDNKENHYSDDFSNLLQQIKQHIETDLQVLSVNETLKANNKELEDLNTIKSRFLSLISHDIRGELGTLNELLKLILSDFESFEKPEVNEMLELISQNASSSYLALEGLLSWSKNDFLHLRPDRSEFDLVPMIEDILNYFRQSIKIKNLQIVKSYDTDKLLMVADKNMMLVALRNIISNSIKYTKNEGDIFIRIVKDGEIYSIEIEDSGLGMDKSSLERLFRYDKTHRKEGTLGESSAGIGLMIAKEFLDKNKAILKVDSELGKGTKFEIML